MRQVTHAHKVAPESCNKPSGAIFVSWYLFRREKSWYTENDNSEFEEEKQMRKLLPILQIIDLVLLLLSLYFHNDMLLIVAAVVIAVCVVLTFSNMKNKR